MRLRYALCLLAVLATPALALAGSTSGSTSMICGACNSTTPLCISLVGSTGGIADAGGAFEVVVRDLANNPVAGASVVIDLSGAPDLAICADQLDPAAIVDCVQKTVRKTAAADGSVHFTVLGGSNGGGNAVALLGAGKIYANGTLIQSPTVSAFDLDGSGGVGANDLSVWFGDFGSGQPYGRSDYDCSGNVGANDLSMWLGAFGSGTMVESCATRCP